MLWQRSEEPATFTVLLVCTGNICRSALAERLGRAYLDDVLAEKAAAIRLISAGTQAVVGSAMHPDTALVLRGLGGEPLGFRAQQLVASTAAEADLTLTMTRAHRRKVLELAPRALARTFTLREAADLLALVSDVADGGGSPAVRARALVKEMAAVRGRRTGGESDDVRDPIGLPVEVHAETGEVIAGALIAVLSRIAAVAVADGRAS